MDPQIDKFIRSKQINSARSDRGWRKRSVRNQSAWALLLSAMTLTQWQHSLSALQLSGLRISEWHWLRSFGKSPTSLWYCGKNASHPSFHQSLNSVRFQQISFGHAPSVAPIARGWFRFHPIGVLHQMGPACASSPEMKKIKLVGIVTLR